MKHFKKFYPQQKSIPKEKIQEILTLSPEEMAARGIVRLAKDGKSYCCPAPNCQNGTGNSKSKKGKGITPNLYNGIYSWKCFSCGANFNNIHILAISYGLDTKRDFVEICRRACADFGIYLPENDFAPTPARKFQQNKIPAAPMKQKAFSVKPPAAEYSRLAESRENLPAFVKKQGGNWRGLSLETLQRLNWGFLQNYKHPDNNFVFPAVIIPNDLNGILARRVDGNSKSNISPTATTTIFLPDSEEFDLVITEGAINGASILQAVPAPTFGIMASGGTSGNKNVLAKLQQLTAKGKKIRVIIAYDGDKPGQKAALKLYETLKNAGYYVFIHTIILNSKIDLNDFLRNQGADQLKEYVESSLVDARKSFDEEKANELKKAEDKKQVPADVENNADNSADDYFAKIEKEIAADEKAFEEEKAAAKEKISNLVTFGNDVMFQEEILKAAAFCKLFFPADYSRLINDIRAFNNENPKTTVNLQDFKGELKEYIAEIRQRESDLKHRETVLNATKKTADFISRDDFLSNATIPAPFAMNSNGLFKVSLAQEIQICRAPIVIRRIVKDLNSKTIKIILAYYENNKLVEIPAVTASTIADKRNIPKLADNGLPVTSNNAAAIVEFFDAFKFANKDLIPLDYSVKNCGWLEYDGQNIFIDPRWTYKFFNADNSPAGNLIVDSDCYIAHHLKSKGTFEKSKQAFNAVADPVFDAIEKKNKGEEVEEKISPLAVFICYLAVSGFLLRILGERNFVFYIHGNTRGGKSTALKLATSMLGSEKLIFTFDATAKVIPELAANYSDYCLPIDEKQVADEKLRKQFQAVIYSLANGIGRIKLNKDSTIRVPKDWQNITIANGETPLIGDNVTGGANTRLFSIAAPDVIIDAETCDFVREIDADNYGLAFPRVLELSKKFGNEKLRENFKNVVEQYKKHSKKDGKENILPEYCRYVSVGFVGGFLLHMVFGDDEKTAFKKAFSLGLEILKLAPTLAEISDVEKAKILIQDFISVNQNRFEGGNADLDKMQKIWGSIKYSDFYYIAPDAVETACKEKGIDYNHIVEILLKDGYFVRGKDRPTVQKWIGKDNGRYFRIRKPNQNG